MTHAKQNATVFIKKASYDYRTLKSTIFNLIESTSPNLINKKSRVVIKPNFLCAADPDHAITTHPLVVKAVCEYVLEAGSHPVISDSPAIGSMEKVLKPGGYKDALQDLDVTFKEFKHSVSVDIGHPFGHIDIAEDVMAADVVINLPKLKTHCQMMLTLGVKNLFGCIVGFKKAEWHLKTGIDRELFAELLVRIWHVINPELTLVDGILAMEGQGPGRSGQPRSLGLLICGNHAVAVDTVICNILGLSTQQLLTNASAKALNLTKEEIHVNGTFDLISDYSFPTPTPLIFGPKPCHGLVRRYLLQRPIVTPELCSSCGRCWQLCPVSAITWSMDKMAFNYNKCVRCYCCIEVCPHGALTVFEPVFSKILRKLKIIAP